MRISGVSYDSVLTLKMVILTVLVDCNIVVVLVWLAPNPVGGRHVAR